MRKLLTGLFLIFVVLMAIGCSSSAEKNIVVEQPTKIQATPTALPISYEEKLVDRCVRNDYSGKRDWVVESECEISVRNSQEKRMMSCFEGKIDEFSEMTIDDRFELHDEIIRFCEEKVEKGINNPEPIITPTKEKIAEEKKEVIVEKEDKYILPTMAPVPTQTLDEENFWAEVEKCVEANTPEAEEKLKEDYKADLESGDEILVKLAKQHMENVMPFVIHSLELDCEEYLRSK